MAKITSGALDWLRATFGVTALTQTTELEDGAVSLVSDVSRRSALELSPGQFGGYWIGTATQTHVGAGFITDALDLINPTAASNAYAMDEATQWAWIVDAWGASNSQPNFLTADVGIDNITGDRFIGPSDGAPDSVGQLLWRASAAGSQNMGGTLPLIPDIPPFPPRLIQSPQDGLQLNSRAQIGAATITLNVMIWIGLRGVLPPGMQ